MSSLPLQARSTTELVDAAIQLYRRDAMRYMLLTALAYAPLVLLQFVVFNGSPDAAELATPTGMLVYVAMFIGFSLISAALARMAASAYMGQPQEIDESIREVLPRVPALVVSTTAKYFLFMLGLIAFVVPGFYVITRYFATTQAIVLEGAGIGAAFSRSSVLSKGLKRHIFNTLALVWIIYLIVAMGATMLAATFGELVVSVVSALVTVVAYPMVGIAEVVLYYDARIRQEGYDIEVMAGALDGAPASV